MPYVYIMLCDSGTRVSKMLKLFTKEKFNHASIALHADCVPFYSYARRAVKTPWDSGFIQETPTGGVFRMMDDVPCKIYRLEVSDEDFKKIERRVMWFCDRFSKCRYSFVGIPLSFFQVPYHRKYRFTCSGFVAWVLKGVGNLPKDHSVIAPHELEALQMECIYEGNYHDYYGVQNFKALAYSS